MHHHPAGKIPSPLTLLLIACLATGCVELEFDRMAGMAFPPSQMVNGQTVTLETIYNEAGVRLTVEVDQTNLAELLSVDSCINDAELSSLEIGRRDVGLSLIAIEKDMVCHQIGGGSGTSIKILPKSTEAGSISMIAIPSRRTG